MVTVVVKRTHTRSNEYCCFSEYRIWKLLNTDDDEGPTYIIQYSANAMEDYERYLTIYADELRNKSFNKWGDNFITFRSLMEVVE